jgi:copper chaperone CopZ
VRSALLAVKGVTRAQVSLETHEAVVTYDPRATNVDALLAALNAVEEPFPFRATIKQAPSPAAASGR